MSWEQITKHQFGGAAYSGENWFTKPCIVIVRQQILFNQIFSQNFSFRPKDIICVFLDRENNRIGFKHASSEHEMASGYTISGDSRSKTLHISAQKIFKWLPDHVKNKALPGSMAPGQIMIVCELPQPTVSNV